MSSFVRRFTSDPGNDVLLNIESINILDLTPPAALQGIGTGTVLCVGEMEDGPYAFPLEVDSANAVKANFGSIGYTYSGVQGNNPSAIARKADGAGVPEYWNGHALVQLNGKQFSRLLMCRVNTSVGSVQLTRLPFVQGQTAAISWTLAPGQVVQLDVGAGPQSATFSAASATTTSSGATFAVNPGDTVTLGADLQANFTATFLSGDGTLAGVIARINQYAGFAMAVIAAGLTGISVGTNGSNYTGVPAVAIGQPQNPTGTQAAATASMGVYSIAITNGGSGYGSAPTVTISGGGGTGATATATLTGGVVTSITITGHGSGYTSQPSVSFSGSGGAAATAYLGVASVTVGTAGSGYTSVPAVSFVGGGGSGALATASMSTTAFALMGLVQGTSGQVRVVSSSTAGVLTALGLTAATTVGTGNVANIASVQRTEVQSVVQGAIANTRVDFTSGNNMRISNTSPTTAPYILVMTGTTATAFGLPTTIGTSTASWPNNTSALNTQQGQAIVVSGTTTLPPNNADTITLGVDAQTNVTVTFGGSENTISALCTAINNAFAAVGQPAIAYADGSSNFYLTSQLQNTTAAQVRVVASSSQSVLTKLGLTLGTTLGAGVPIGQVPAGTIVQVPGAQGPIFVLAQSVNFTSTGVLVGGLSKAAGGTIVPTAGPFSVPIRHALDDGSGLLATAGSITTFGTVPDQFSFSVVNLAATSAALTEAQIDAQYVLAMANTTAINSVVKQTNIVFSARQSNTIRAALRSNADTASASGCYGRVACIRPPLNTNEYTAIGNSAPGVGATRDERVIYCYIGSNVYVPIIALRGLAGNPVNTNYTAFTVDGNIDVGSDSLMASILSQLAPEENPGQDTPYATVVNGIETGANVQNFAMPDYQMFKAAGIAALRVDDGAVSFQSGVTSVDPNVYPSQTTIARRRMADYIQDSIAIAGKAFGKKLNSLNNRRAFAHEIKVFLEGLLSANNPAFQRINGYTLDYISANTQTTLGQGIFRIIIKVQTIASMDAIVLQTTIGTQVTVQEVLPAQAA